MTSGDSRIYFAIPATQATGILYVTKNNPALKLAKECHEAVFKLVDEGPSVMYLKQLQEKLIQIESRQIC